MSLWKLSPNCDKGVSAVGARKPKVHQGDVRPMTTKFSYRFHGIRRLSHEKHVLLRADDGSQSLAEDRMILYAQDTNRLGLNHYDRPVSKIVMVCLSSGQILFMRHRDQPV
jgi:hypothetical protein